VWSNFDLQFADGALTARLARWCHRWFHRTIAASGAVKARFAPTDDNTVVIYGGLDIERFRFVQADRAALRHELGVSESTTVIGIVGSIEEGKGHHLLLEAIRELVAQGANLVLAIVGRFASGEPAYEHRIRVAATELGPAVRLLGFREDVTRLYSGLDVVVNATTSHREEPLGTTIYEGMACERVVVATRTGGSPEIITDGVDGFLCAPDDSSALRHALARAVAERDTLDALRVAARHTVVARFSVERMRADYQRLLGGL
jgi:glycosyltransferase involved in cell wall biosynthesis